MSLYCKINYPPKIIPCFNYYRVNTAKINFGSEVFNMHDVWLIFCSMIQSRFHENPCFPSKDAMECIQVCVHIHKTTDMKTMNILMCKHFCTSMNGDRSSRQLNVLNVTWKSECLTSCFVLSCRFSRFNLRVIYTVLSLIGTFFMTCLCVIRFFKYGRTFQETRKSSLFWTSQQIWKFELE
jgi:hypothetical protein